MNKLIFRKFFIDVLTFFIIASLSITLIIWVIQSVNLLDFVSEDGHSLGVYFAYTTAILPKIFSRIMIFVYFVSIFYIINKYEVSNEILIFWSNGIKKINFINFIFRFSLIFLIIQLFLNVLVVPYSQNLGRIYLKNSNIDFLPNLISEKKFISVFENLTMFTEKYNKRDGTFEKIYIKEVIDKNKSKIISASEGKLIKQEGNYVLKLFHGGITNIEKKNNKINFSETIYDLSKFSTKTITHPKIQEISSYVLMDCIYRYHLKNKEGIEKELCNGRPIQQVSEEIFKRSIVPFYIVLLGLISSTLIVKPRKVKFQNFHKLNIFFIGFLTIIFSQLSFKLIGLNNTINLITLFLPILLIMIFYSILAIKTNFKLNTL